MTIKTKVSQTFKVGDLVKSKEPVTDVEVNPKTKTYEAVRPLREWEEECVRHYIESGFDNKSESYRHARAKAVAKWKDDTIWKRASEFFQKPEVMRRVDEVREHIKNETNITAEYVTERVKEIVERCMQHQPVYTKKGEPLMLELADGTMAAAYTFDANAALKGLDHLAKIVPNYYDADSTPIQQMPVINIGFVSPGQN